MATYWLKVAGGLAAVAGVGIAFTFERPPVQTVQRGFRGTGMQEVFAPNAVRVSLAANQVPAPEPAIDPAGTPSSQAYQNVQVLQTVDSNEFLRLMTAITAWVSPQQGCAYCHNTENMADDSLYTKRVARRMFQMVQRINAGWKTHVKGTGVTCYTCHRGMPVPANIWFKDPGREHFNGMAQAYSSMAQANPTVGYSSLPSDVFTPFLEEANNIRLASTTALPSDDRHSIKQTEWTYGLMVHMSTSLGVNCSYCHNTRAFSDWSQSTPQRSVAWYGIRMVRELNNEYLNPLQADWPAYRLGAAGDGPKLNCTTCHQGVYKPLYGVSMLTDYPELSAPSVQAQAWDGSATTASLDSPGAAPQP